VTQRVKARPKIKRNSETPNHFYKETKKAKKNKAKEVHLQPIEVDDFEDPIEK